MSRAKDFVKWLNDGRVQIQRPGKLSKRKAEKYLKDLEDVSEYGQAIDLLGKVEEIVTALPESDAIRTSIVTQAQKLNAERKKIKDCEQEVAQYKKLAEGNTTVRNLLLVLRAYPKRPDTYLTYDDGFYVEGETRLNERLAAEVAKQAQQPLTRIEQYEAVRNSLREMRDALRQAGRQDLEQLAVDALGRIEEEYKRLVARGKESAVLTDVESFNIKDAGLAACRKHAARTAELLHTKLVDASEGARERVNRNLQQTDKRIVALEAWLSEFAGRAESASDLQTVGALRDEALSHERDYLDTPELDRLREIRARIEDKQKDLQENAAAEARLQAMRDEYVRGVKEGGARVLRMQSFDAALPEWDDLNKMAETPGGLILTDQQHDLVRDNLRRAGERVETLYRDLLRERALQTEQAYATQVTALDRALDAVGRSSSAPAEWHQSLVEARQKLDRALAEWRDEQSRLAEERRRAESEKRCEEDNRRVVDAALRQTKHASSLREIRNAVSAIAESRDRLIPPADEEVNRLGAEERRLLHSEEKLRAWVADALPAELSVVNTVKDVNNLRQKVATHESLCAGDPAIGESLRQARNTLDRRADLFNRLNTLERQTVTLSRGDELLSQYADLKSEHPDMTVRIEAGEETVRRRLDALRAAERRQVEDWMKQFRVSDEKELTAKKVGELLHALERPPHALTPQDEEFLAGVQQKLVAVCSRDIADRIFDDFTRLQTPEQRAECLLRLLEIFKREFPAEYSDRLASRLEQPTSVASETGAG